MKGFLANLAMMAFGLLIGLLALEFGVRLAGHQAPSMRPDPILGQRYIERARFRHVGEEGQSNGRYNSAGWRDAEHSIATPAGTTRILILGDSFVAAFQVPLDSTFHRRLERLLNARALPGRRFEVIALGQDGNGTTAEYLTWEHWGRAYAPDVVAPLFVQNDPADNVKDVALDKQRPFFVEAGDSLVLDDSFRETPGFRKWSRPNWLGAHSALYQALRLALGRAMAKKKPPRLASGEVQDGYYRSWNFARDVLADTLAANRLTARIYAKFARDVGASGARFVVFHTGFAQEEDRDLLAANRADSTFDVSKTARWLMSVGAREGFPVVPLSPAFRRASVAAGGRKLWFGKDGLYGHWNSEGHAVAAEAMARYFARTLPGLDTTGTTEADVPGMGELGRY